MARSKLNPSFTEYEILSSFPITIAPGKAPVNVAISYTPSVPGLAPEMNLVIHSDDPDEAQVVVPLSGNGAEPGIEDGIGISRLDGPLTGERSSTKKSTLTTISPSLTPKYESALCRELELHKVSYQRHLALSYRIDILVAQAVVVEVKSVEKVLPIHQAQLLTYLKLGGYQIGLLLNFNVPQLRDGIVRRVLGLQEE